MIRLRVLLGTVGVAVALYGLWSMREFDFDQLRSLGLWLAGGVVLHDGILAPLTVLLGLVASRVLPERSRKAVVVGFVLWGTLTVVAFAVLSGMGGKPDNATLLDRDYRLSWLIGTVALAVVVAAVSVLRARRRTPA